MTKSIVKSFVGFLGHYADEALLISAALKATLTAVPVDAQDKAHILDAIERLENLPANIAASIAGLSGVKETEVRISKKDLDAAVAAELPSVLAKVLPGLLEASIKEAVEAATAVKEGGDKS